MTHSSPGSETLLPCPFCGARARTDLLPHSGGPGWVQCSECECDQHMSNTLDEAVARWNHRTPAQCEQQPTAFVPVHRRQGPLWSDTFPAGSDLQRSENYPRMPLYAAPPQSALRAWTDGSGTWQTVPLPATAEMLVAADRADAEMRAQGFANAETEALYYAMLDAAPPYAPPQAAGSAEQRKRWFSTGFKEGTVKACNTFGSTSQL